MKKNKLSWRLKDLPTADEVASLVETKVITAQEARELLFSDTQEEPKKVKALEEEVKFLRELVDKLAMKSNGWGTIVHEYREYRPRYPYWYNTYGSIVKTLESPTFVGYSSTAGNLALSSKLTSKVVRGSVGSTSIAVSNNGINELLKSNQDIKGLSSLN